MDEGNTSRPRIRVLSRYSIENYQLDPIIVLGVLIDEKKATPLPNVAVTPGDEHQVRTLPASTLQSVVDYVAQQVEMELGTLTSGKQALAKVTLTTE